MTPDTNTPEASALPPLPDPSFGTLAIDSDTGEWRESRTGHEAFCAGQLHAYARAALTATPQAEPSPKVIRGLTGRSHPNDDGRVELRFDSDANARAFMNDDSWYGFDGAAPPSLTAAPSTPAPQGEPSNPLVEAVDAMEGQPLFAPQVAAGATPAPSVLTPEAIDALWRKANNAALTATEAGSVHRDFAALLLAEAMGDYLFDKHGTKGPMPSATPAQQEKQQ